MAAKSRSPGRARRRSGWSAAARFCSTPAAPSSTAGIELKDALLDALAGFEVSYREIDPDVFGEELEREDYADVERIAVVGLVAVRR